MIMSIHSGLLKLTLAGSLLTMAVSVAAAQAIPTRCNGCFAVVNADGSILRQRDVVSVNRVNTGRYEVTFRIPIAGCFAQASVGHGVFGNTSGPSVVNFSGVTGTTDALRVQVRDQAGSFIDEPFHVVTAC
jgi:hypothetical protein